MSGEVTQWKRGDKVFWTDPHEGICSGPGTVLVVDTPLDDGLVLADTIIGVKKSDGGYVEVLPHELSKRIEIVVRFSSVDGCHRRRVFRTLAGAQKFAHARVGPHPDIGQMFQYAVSDDGVGKIEVSGCSLEELFPPSQRGVGAAADG